MGQWCIEPNYTPRGLQNAVFFTIGKLFCLHGGKEHRALKLSQLKQDSNVDKYIYHENVSKNRIGSLSASCSQQGGTCLFVSGGWHKVSCALARSLYQQASRRSKGKGSSICATIGKTT